MQALFYSEFDNVTGPKIIFQSPSKYLSSEVFDAVSDYIITGKQLCGSLITVTAFGHKIMSYPLSVEDNKYDRNAFLFTIGFIFAEEEDTRPYHSVLRKLGNTLLSLEVEAGFLFDQSTKSQLSWILHRIMLDLSSFGECTLSVDQFNTINLTTIPQFAAPPEVQDHHVPVRIRDLSSLAAGVEWDLALQRVLPFIDGINYVKKISVEAEVEPRLVKRCLRQLLYYRCITMIDIFQYSNMYCVTRALSTLATRTDLQLECLKYIVRRPQTKPSTTIDTVFRLYSAFQPGLKISAFCTEHKQDLVPIDIIRFVTFGLVHGFLIRIHQYPISNQMPLTQVQGKFDGFHHLDHICCQHMGSPAEINASGFSFVIDK